MAKSNNENKSIQELIKDVLDTDFHHFLEFDYNRERHCFEAGCEGICRCSTLHNIKITYIPVEDIAQEISDSIKAEPITRYCIERALVICKIWDADNWEVTTTGGYYGEEIGSAKLIKTVRQRLNKIISDVVKAKSAKDKIIIILEEEYGYVLPIFEKVSDFEIVEEDILSIKDGAEDHYKKLDKIVVDKYKDRKLPIGIGIRNSSGYIRLIDGYHRLAAKKNTGAKRCEIIVGE